MELTLNLIIMSGVIRWQFPRTLPLYVHVHVHVHVLLLLLLLLLLLRPGANTISSACERSEEITSILRLLQQPGLSPSHIHISSRST